MKKYCTSSVLHCAFSLLLPTILLSGCDNAIGERFYLENGQQYFAHGYISESSGEFSFDKGFTIDFGRMVFKDPFNRIHMSYSSDKPLHVDVNYRQGLFGKTDDFYLEAGDGLSFSGLVAEFVNNQKANTLHRLTFASCDGSTAKFRINDVSTETVSSIDHDVHYLENNRYKVGINLKWGGGISYIEDKKNSQSGLSNLINSHDTGRLIQQSYYGTKGNEAYEPGESFYQKWFYNPVQGGDQFGHPSRLIDFRIDNSSVYTKSQPQDWAKYNCLTPSYMENTYVLDEGYIQVDNRFVDYSGWENPKQGQELPAFYVVSYLDQFVFYNGNEGWTDDTLTIKSDLPFWGPYKEECTFAFNKANTERWCAWFSEEINYGIGIYVPNVEQVCAGRYEYDGSKDAYSNSTNYVSPGSELKIVSFEPIEYSYMITCGAINDIRSIFKDHKDFATNASLNYLSHE